MRYLSIFFLLLVQSAFCQTPVSERGKDWLKQTLESKSDTIYMLNFWATWCLPCVEELPEFEKFLDSVRNPLLKPIFVSLDAPRTAEKKIKSFLSKKKVPGEIVVINAPDYNSWIDLVDISWQGSIPATLFIRGKDEKRWFVEKSISTGELIEISNKFNNP